MADPKDNLKPFKKGEDPRRNLNGRPKGRKSLSTIVRDILESEVDWTKLPVKNTDEFEERYGSKTILAEAMVRAAVVEALSKNGHQAREWLRKSGYGDKLAIGGDEDNPTPILGGMNVYTNDSPTEDSGAEETAPDHTGRDERGEDDSDPTPPDPDSPEAEEAN